MKSKQGLLDAVNEEIQRLQELAKQIESSDEPDLRPVSDLADIMKSRRDVLSLSSGEVGDLRAMEKGGNPTIKSLQAVGKVLNFKLWIEV
jgi:hypothetical protein